MAIRRRELLTGAGVLAASQAQGSSVPWISPDLPDGTRASAHLVQPPGKGLLIELSGRPPNLETPIQSLGSPVTPTDLFFVRYHLAGIPDAERLEHWALTIDGGEQTLTLRQSDLNDLPQTEVTAVCQCAGARRGLVQPHVPGVQWGHGAIGCATWHGPRLRDVLKLAGVKSETLEVWMEGADWPVSPETPAFRKSIPLSKAMADDTIIATSMNGGPLHILNGFPARVVVPGWIGAYWMKHVTHLRLSATALDSFWMKSAYRVPAGLFPTGEPFLSQNNEQTWPVTEILVNSLITTPVHGDEVERSGFTVRGVAWDKGNGILRVDVSLDGGESWQSALLDRELGKYGFRNFRLETGPLPRGQAELRVRAASNSRETQPAAWRANPGGYHNNVPQRLTVKVV